MITQPNEKPAPETRYVFWKTGENVKYRKFRLYPPNVRHGAYSTSNTDRSGCYTYASTLRQYVYMWLTKDRKVSYTYRAERLVGKIFILRRYGEKIYRSAAATRFIPRPIYIFFLGKFLSEKCVYFRRKRIEKFLGYYAHCAGA